MAAETLSKHMREAMFWHLVSETQQTGENTNLLSGEISGNLWLESQKIPENICAKKLDRSNLCSALQGSSWSLSSCVLTDACQGTVHAERRCPSRPGRGSKPQKSRNLCFVFVGFSGIFWDFSQRFSRDSTRDVVGDLNFKCFASLDT